MLRAWLKIFLVILSFTLEVQVNAKVIRSPEACSGEVEPCVIKNVSTVTQNYNFDLIKIRIASGAIMRINSNEIKFLKGDFIVSCLATCLLSSMYVDNIQISEGSALISSSTNKDKIIGLTGTVAQSIWGQGSFPLLPGMYQEIEKSGIKGHKAELPQVMLDEDLVAHLSGLARAPIKLLAFINSEKENTVNFLSEQFKTSIGRKIASDTKKRYINRLQRKKYDNESARLRRLFRKKNRAYN